MKTEILTASHERGRFRSGVAELDRYFHAQAGRDAAKRLAGVFVLPLPDARVAGYYTLAPACVVLPDLLGETTRATSRYPVMPAARLSRLAVDHRHRRQGYGRLLLADALARARSSGFSSIAFIAESAGQEGCDFLVREGFSPFPDHPHRFFRPMADVQ